MNKIVTLGFERGSFLTTVGWITDRNNQACGSAGRSVFSNAKIQITPMAFLDWKD